MKVLVTGGAGFIGSNLVEELIVKGHKVVVLDNLSNGKKENIHPEAEFICGDITEYKILSTATKSVDCIFHLAAFISVPESMQRPEKCFGINVEGTKNVIRAAGKNGIKKIIFSSSSAVYDGIGNEAISENHNLKFSSPYGLSKYEAEKLLDESSKEFNYTYIIFRYFNVFGEHQNPNSPYSAVIPKFISRALNNEKIVVYGDGNQTRDFIYVKDVVNANIIAMESTVKNEIYNIGIGANVSINELAKLIIDKCDSSSKIKYEPEVTGDIRFSLSDISKANNQLEWEPRYNFEDAILSTIEWYRDNFNKNI